MGALTRQSWQIAGRPVIVRVLASGLDVRATGPARIEFLGWHSTTDAVAILSECDVCYVPYWFDAAFRAGVELSFPNKVSLYLATGRPVFFHGPRRSTPTRFLERWPVGLACHSLEPDEIAQGEGGADSVRVLLFPPGDARGPQRLCEGRLFKMVVRFTGYEEGRYDLWVDVRGFAPITLKGVTLGSGETTLPDVVPQRGGALRVRTLLNPGQHAATALGMIALAPAAAAVYWTWRDPHTCYRHHPVQPAALLAFVLYAVGASTGMLLGVKTVDSHPGEVLDLVAAATGDLFQGRNVVEIEKLFDRSRGITDRKSHYFQEIIVFSTNLLHVFLRSKKDENHVAVFVTRASANIGMVIVRSRAAMAAIDASV